MVYSSKRTQLSYESMQLQKQLIFDSSLFQIQYEVVVAAHNAVLLVLPLAGYYDDSSRVVVDLHCAFVFAFHKFPICLTEVFRDT